MANPILSIVSASTDEGEDIVFSVRLSQASDEDITVEYRTRDGSANSLYDYNNVSRVLLIPAGNTAATISIDTNFDRLDEPAESLTLELTNPTGGGASFAGGALILRAAGIIQDDPEDGLGSNLALFVSDATVVEGDAGRKAVSFEIRLSEAQDADLTFAYSTVDGSAKAGSDYVAKTGSVTFKAGQTVASVDVLVNGDRASEGSEGFSLVIKPTSVIKNGVSQAAGEAVILDDDASGPVISVLGDDRVEGEDLTFTVLLSEPSDEDVSFDYRTVDGGATSSDDYSGALERATIPAGQTSIVISIKTTFDKLDEPAESLTLELTNASGGGASFAGGAPILRATGIIQDDPGDGSGSNLALFVSDATIVEGDAGRKAASFEVRLSEAHDEDVSFRYATFDDTAKAGSDYIAKSGVVTFEAGQTVASIDVQVRGDGALELDETFGVKVVPTGVIKNGSDEASGVATIVNDDTADERLFGDGRANTIRGVDGDDEIYGLGGRDSLFGGEGDDTLDGGAADDRLFGGAGADRLLGGEGGDRLIGDAGRDVVTGGGGADVFAFLRVGDSGPGAGARDTITDFTRGVDLIDLATIDANADRAGNQKFVFVGSDRLDGAGEVRFANGVLSGDVDGDGQADFSITLAKARSLSAEDFLL